MVLITIDDNLAQAITNAGKSITLVDSRGQVVAQITQPESGTAAALGMTPEHMEELERRMAEDDGTRIPFEEVIRRVRELAPE